MAMMRGRGLLTVDHSGAEADCVLCGCGLSNQGLRLRVAEEQAKGNEGPITGPFVILDVGHSKQADSLKPLLHRPTDAAEVFDAIREQHAGCVNAVNANILMLEPD